MDNARFERIIEELTPRQRQVLKPFLLGQDDEAIAQTLQLDNATIRRHLANICKQFEFQNETGEHYSHREALLQLFIQHRPSWVTPQRLRSAMPSHPAIPPSKTQVRSEGQFPGQPLALASPFYVDRPPIEARCQAELAKAGALVRIRAPRRMGKTSLLNRSLVQVQASGDKAIRISLGQVAPDTLADLDPFLQWICIRISQKLGLSISLADYWDKDFGSLISCTTYMQALLQGLDSNLVLGLDEVDWLLEYPDTARGFFALLRSWHEEANSLAVWQKLRLIVVHSTEVYIPLNLHQSPFNVGLPLRLPVLTVAQTMALAQVYGLGEAEGGLRSLHTLVNGHPYLLQLAFYHLQQDELSLTNLLTTAPTQAGIYSHHLRRLWQTLKEKPELQQALAQVIATPSILEPTLAYQLESMALIELQGNLARVSCELYAAYFRAMLGA